MTNDKTKKFVYITGPVLYAKVFERNRDKGNVHVPLDPKFDGRYTIQIGVDDKITKKIKKWNRLYEGKTISEMKEKTRELLSDIVEKHGESLRYFTFWRNNRHVLKNGDEVIAWGGVPQVVDAEGEPWDPNINIGNGSVCTVKLDVSKTGNNTFVRLEGVRVENLVEYEEEKIEVENYSDGLAF